MKITDFLIIFLIIIFPLMIFAQWRAEDTNTFAKLNHQYDGAMTVAANDSADQLRINAKPNFESGYTSEKFVNVNKEMAYDTFIQTLSLNFNSEDAVTQDLLARYVPVYGILEYDGFSMNVYNEINKGTTTLLERTWLPKLPFSYSDPSGNVIQFTLDEYVSVYDAVQKEWYEGEREEVAKDVTVDLLNDATRFDKVRRDTIVQTLQDNLAYQINEHNVYTKSLGITYKFTLPLIPEEDWYNTVNDIGIFAFFQGYPYERVGGIYNQFAFVGTRIDRNEVYYATKLNNQKVFYAGSCGFNHSVIESYPSKKAAAKAGYSEISCLNQTN